MRGIRLLLIPILLPLMAACVASPPSPPPARGAPSSWRGDSKVLTAFGWVQGQADREETWVWKAVPFARPPLGELRWRAPRDPEPWSGVRARRRFAGPCTQYQPLTGRIIGSEDCLYLNIWRPRSAQADLPVYVWIHGGGNSMGSAAYVPDYYGHRLARAADLVFVSVNYRLGPFGWFTYPALREGRSPLDDSGNYGTLDLIQALRWIRENIRAFGGDPQKVLIAGQSAGAMNVLSLLLSPQAGGLFQRAVAQSGALRTAGLPEGQESARQVLLRLLIGDRKAGSLEEAERLLAGMGDGAVREYLRSVPGRRLLSVYVPGRAGMIDFPSIFLDGGVLPAGGFAAFDTGEYPGKVPLIVGSNQDEVKLFLFLAGSPPWRSDLFRAAARFGSERWKAEGVDGVARRLAAHPDQPPVYAYLFAWGAPDEGGRSPLPGSWGRKLGAFHSLEIPFFLGTDTIFGRLLGPLLFTESNRQGRQALSAAMVDYLGWFLRTGDPNRPESGLPIWRPWSNEPGGGKCILLAARGDRPAIRMLDRQLTIGGIEAAMAAELPPDLLAQTRAVLARPLAGRPGSRLRSPR